MKRKVLHRDISPANVYGKPGVVNVKALTQFNRIENVDIPDWCCMAATEAHPSIRNIINAYVLVAAHPLCLLINRNRDDSASSLCMLADFHLAAIYPAERLKDNERLKNRTVSVR